MRVLIAPHHFGPLLTPDIAAGAIAAGWRSVRPGDDILTHPHSDGSVGFLSVVSGSTEIVTTTHAGTPRPVSVVLQRTGTGATMYAHTETFTGEDLGPAQLEAADSAAMGDLLGTALDKGAGRVVIGADRAPWHDAGAGMIHRLAERLGVAPGPLRETGGNIAPHVAELLGPLAERLRGVQIIAAAARDVPLLGLHGAGANLSELPGIDPADAQRIEARTTAFISALEARAESLAPPSLLLGGAEPRLSRRPFSGGGGGVVFALAALGASVHAGARATGQETGLTAALTGADLVVTGAEVLDGHELAEGVVADVAARAGTSALPVIALARRVDASRRQLFKVGIHAAYPVLDPVSGRPHITLPPVTEAALTERGARLAQTWSR